jgi:hypothetical protein
VTGEELLRARAKLNFFFKPRKRQASSMEERNLEVFKRQRIVEHSMAEELFPIRSPIIEAAAAAKAAAAKAKADAHASDSGSSGDHSSAVSHRGSDSDVIELPAKTAFKSRKELKAQVPRGHSSMPAAFGSYSKWAGHMVPDFPWEHQLPTSNYSTPMIPDAGAYEAVGAKHRGDPGAYSPYVNSEMAVRALGQAFNKKGLAERVLADETLSSEHDPQPEAKAEGARRPLANAVPPVELFAYNRRALRDVAPTGIHSGSQSSLPSWLPSSWIRGAEAASQAVIDHPQWEAMGSGTAAAAAEPGGGVLMLAGPMAGLGGVVDARRLRDEQKLREVEEKRTRWEARHGGRAPPTPPPPPPGAGERACERLFDTDKARRETPTSWSSTKQAAPRNVSDMPAAVKMLAFRAFKALDTVTASGAAASGAQAVPDASGPFVPPGPKLFMRAGAGSGSQRVNIELPAEASERAPAAGTSRTTRTATARSYTGRSASPTARSSKTPRSSRGGTSAFRSGSSQRPATARSEQGSPRKKGAGAGPSSPPSTRRKVKRHPRSLNCYGILHLESDATDKEIKDAYHKLAKEWHPDRNRDERAQRTFLMVKRAYEVLADPKTRELFDRGVEVPFT